MLSFAWICPQAESVLAVISHNLSIRRRGEAKPSGLHGFIPLLKDPANTSATPYSGRRPIK